MSPEAGQFAKPVPARIVAYQIALRAPIQPLRHKIPASETCPPNRETRLDRARGMNLCQIHSGCYQRLAFDPRGVRTVPWNLHAGHHLLPVFFHPPDVGDHGLIQQFKGIQPADVAIEYQVAIRHFAQLGINDKRFPCPETGTAFFQADVTHFVFETRLAKCFRRPMSHRIRHSVQPGRPAEQHLAQPETGSRVGDQMDSRHGMGNAGF